MVEGDKLSIETERRDGIPIVRARGEIDLYTVSEFDRALKSEIQEGPPALIVDLSDLSYIDSAGLTALLAAYNSLSVREAQIYVVAPPGNPGVARVLEVTRFDALVKVCDTVDEALRELNTARAA